MSSSGIRKLNLAVNPVPATNNRESTTRSVVGQYASEPAKRFGQLLLLTTAATAAIYARTTVGPLQEGIRTALRLSDNQMALMQGPALALPLVIAAVPLGLAIDRYNRVRLILILTLLCLVGSLLTASASGFLTLFAARCLIGLTGTPIYLVSISLLSDLYGVHQRGRATMVVTFGAVIGMSAAFALGGELLAVSGSQSDGWRGAMLWLAVPQALVTFLLLMMREPARTGVIVEQPSLHEAYAELRRYRPMIVPVVLALAMVVIADGASTIWAAPTLARRFGVAPERYGAILSVALLVSGVAGPVLGGVLTDSCQRRGGPGRTVSALAALALLSVPVGLFAVAPTVSSVSILLVLFMTIGVAFNVAVPALITVVVPNELRGTCLTLCSATCMLSAFGVAPVAVSLLSGAMGGTSMIGQALAVVCVITSLIGAVIFAYARRSFATVTG